MKTLYLDTETYSPTPISCGVYKYAEKCEIMLVSCAWGEYGSPMVLDLTDEYIVPADFYRKADEIVCHGAMFDRTVLRLGNLKLDVPIEKFRCTMTQCLAHSLPASLQDACDALGVPHDRQKDRGGHRWIQLFCKPNKDGARNTRLTHPFEWERFKDYALQDIIAMREVDKRTPVWNRTDGERRIYILDQEINDRGFEIDQVLAERVIDYGRGASVRSKQDIAESTGGLVNSVNQRDKIMEALLFQHGVTLPDLSKDTLTRRLDDQELPQGARDLIRLRLDSVSNPVAKYKKAVEMVSNDGRLRGMYQMNGAMRTGRWSGKGNSGESSFNPTNMSRPDRSMGAVELDIDLMKDELFCALPEPKNSIKSAVRGLIVAGKGKKLVVGDWSSIEGRALAWLANETWKLDAFRAEGEGGPGIYELAYSRMFDVPVESVDDDQRQIGKVCELALGYKGGVGAFVSMSQVYNLDLADMACRGYAGLPDRFKAQAKKNWSYWGHKAHYDLTEAVWLMCEALKLMWREANGGIVKFADSLEVCCRHLSDASMVNGLKIVRQGAWLRIELPSGRSLCYPGWKVDERENLSYLGRNQYFNKWSRIDTYAGKLTENVTQALCAELLKFVMLRCDDKIVMHNYDEIVTEVDEDDMLGIRDLQSCMTQEVPWLKGFPLAVKLFETKRYGKEVHEKRLG